MRSHVPVHEQLRPALWDVVKAAYPLELPQHRDNLLQFLVAVNSGDDVSRYASWPPEEASDFTAPLLRVCNGAPGVGLCIGLHALKSWVEAGVGHLEAAIHQAATPALLNLLVASVPSVGHDPPSAYCASTSVSVLRRILRKGPPSGVEAFVQHGGVQKVLELANIPMLDDRFLCLCLCLLNDAVTASGEALEQVMAAGGMRMAVSILRQSSCVTSLQQHKRETALYACILVHRCSLSADHVLTIRQAGALGALLDVLHQQSSPSYKRNVQGMARSPTPSLIAAYALSSISTLCMTVPQDVMQHVLAQHGHLAGISTAIADYQASFSGPGVPHHLLANLAAGDGSVELVTALATQQLLPFWLAAHNVGEQLTLRCAEPDVQAALDGVPPSHQVQVAKAFTHLLQRSPSFLPALQKPGRLEALAKGALHELVIQSNTAACAERQWSKAEQGAHDAATPAQPSACESDGTLLEVPTPMPATPGHTRQGDGPATPCMLPVSSVGEELEQPTALSAEALNLHSVGAVISSDAGQEPGSCLAALSRTSSWASDTTAEKCDSPVVVLSARKRARTAAPAGPSPSSDGDCRCCTARSEERHSSSKRYDTLTFVVGERQVHARGFVLERESPVLDDMLSSLQSASDALVVPTIGGLSDARMHAAFTRAVDWCYLRQAEGLHAAQDILDLWTVADFLQMDRLQRCCEKELPQAFQFTGVLEATYHLALCHDSKPLRTVVGRHVLAGLTSGGISDEVAVLAATNAKTLAADVAAALREQLDKAAKVLV